MLSEKKRESNRRWDAANLRRMSLALPVGLYDELKAHTDRTGESLNGFIRNAITAALEGNTSGAGRVPATACESKQASALPDGHKRL